MGELDIRGTYAFDHSFDGALDGDDDAERVLGEGDDGPLASGTGGGVFGGTSSFDLSMTGGSLFTDDILLADASDDDAPVPLGTIRDGFGDALAPDRDYGSIRVYAEEEVTIAEFDNAAVDVDHRIASREMPLSVPEKYEHGSDTRRMLQRESIGDLNRDLDGRPAIVFGSGFYNSNLSSMLLPVKDVRPYEDAFFHQFVQDGEIEASVRDPDAVNSLLDMAGEPAVVVTRSGELKVVDRTDEMFVRDASGTVELDVDGNPLIDPAVQHLVPGQRPSDFALDENGEPVNPARYVELEAEGQIGNSANLVVQFDAASVPPESGLAGKTFVIQTSREGADALDEADAMELFLERLGFDEAGRAGLVEGTHYDAVALDPGSSLGVLAKPADGGLEEQNEFDSVPVPAAGLNGRVNNPRFFVVTGEP